MTRPFPVGSSRRGPGNRSLRITFEYRDDDVKMVSVQRLAMMPPPPQGVTPRENERGSWVELHDSEGRAIYRRAIANPIRRDIEVVAEDPERPLARVRAEEVRGTFFVIVPDLAEARRVVLRTEPSAAPGAAALAAAEPKVHEFDLPGNEKGDD